MSKKIAYRFDLGSRNMAWYVSELPGQGGVDWGYNKDAKKAIGLSLYWQRRFNADMRCAGSQAHFLEADPASE